MNLAISALTLVALLLIQTANSHEASCRGDAQSVTGTACSVSAPSLLQVSQSKVVQEVVTHEEDKKPEESAKVLPVWSQSLAVPSKVPSHSEVAPATSEDKGHPFFGSTLTPSEDTHSQLGLKAPGTASNDCVGTFSGWSTCGKNCAHHRTFKIIRPASEGGEHCNHPAHFVQERPCLGDLCKEEELPPTGDLPGGEKPHTSVHHLALEVELPFFIAMILSLCIGEVCHHSQRLSFVPHSLVTMIVSGALGLILRAHQEDRFGAEGFSPVCTGVMNLLLLPIIIFQAGWVMQHNEFGRNFFHICVFAVVGTVVSTAAIAGLIVLTGSWGWHVITTTREALAIAALISATDPVATLATFTEKRVESRLHVLVLGESMINDAVAIAFFNLLNMDEPTSSFNVQSAANRTVKLFSISVFVGFLMGAVLSAAFRGVVALSKRAGPEHEEHESSEEGGSFEILYVICAAYLTNAVAECVHMSGIIACLFSGVTMGIYLRPHLSPSREKQVSYYISTTAETADLTVFIMVGVTTALIKSSKGFRFGSFLLLFCFLGRAVSVLVCGTISNVSQGAYSRDGLMEYLPPSRLLMMWHSGLRGGIALMLALELNDWCEHKAVLVTSTFIVISALMVLCGSTTDVMLKILGIQTGCEPPEQTYDEVNDAAKEATSGPKGLAWFAGELHTRVLHPILVGDAKIKAAAIA